METDRARTLLNDEASRLREIMQQQDRDETLQPALEDQGESSVDQHPGDVGTETVERETEQAIRLTVEAELADIEAALERLDAGTYGRCEVDGEPIPDERLEAVPAARYCVRHQAERERAQAP